MKRIAAFLLTLALAAVFAIPGAAAPDLETRDSTGWSVLGFSSVNILTGETVTSDVINNTTLTLINEWAHWCGPCMNEMPHFQSAHEYYSSTPEDDVQIIGCAYDTPLATAQNLLNSNGYTWLNVMEDTVLGNVFSTEGYIPQTIIVDRHGVVRDHIVRSFSSVTALRQYIDGWYEILRAEEGLPGDVDGDGSITANDALAIMRMAMGLMPCTDLYLADMNGDGTVDSSDALEAMRMAMGLI